MKQKLLLLTVLLGVLHFAASAQCVQPSTVTVSAVPDNCTSALNLNSYYTSRQPFTVNNTTATTSGQLTAAAVAACLGTEAKDLFFESFQPCTNIPAFNKSFVFRWSDWPGKATGVAPPKLAVHAEVGGSLSIVNIPYDCTAPAPTQTPKFAAENVYCSTGEQLYLPINAVPCPPFTLQGANITQIGFYFQAITSNGATGPMTVEVSKYQQGFLCGDALPITLSGTGNNLNASVSSCLNTTALNGTMFSSLANNLPVPCGVESPAAAWYSVTLPFSCNKLSLNMSNWGGSGNYNLALVSGVSCPGTTATDPISGGNIYTPGETLAPGAVVEAGACGQPLNICRPLAAGTYWIYVSGTNDRPSFTLDVQVQNAAPTAGSATSSQNNTNVCSGSSITASTSGTVLPLSSCGQNIAWFYSTNINFNPYSGQGTYLASGTSGASLTLPANNNCSPVTYYIKGVVSDNGTTAAAACQSSTGNITVTVYPEVGLPSVNNTTCAITVAPRCPSFTVNGTAGTYTFIAGPNDDGTTQAFTISNGLGACNVVTTEVVSCNLSCQQPTATATSTCNSNDPYNFYVNVNFAPGSAPAYIIEASDGSQLSVSTAGTYQIGPFANGNSISVSVNNAADPSCNLPLGNFVRNCNPSTCPNLTSAFISVSGGGSSVCEGNTILLQATVDHGVPNVDYAIQWYLDGVAIPGATLPVYSHTITTAQGCGAEVQQFSVAITCLNPNAAPSTTSTLNTTPASLTVYPKPDLGVNFAPALTNCVVAPQDLCGGLNISYTPTSNPTVGTASTTVNYTVSVNGAPSGCAATGTYNVQCPAATCTQSAGNGVTPPDNVICYGSNFDITTTGTSVATGWALGYAWTTTDPFSNLSTALQTAISQNHILGPFAAGQTITYPNDGSVFPSGGRVYFIPFTSLNVTASNQFLFTNSGTLNCPFGGASQTRTINLPNNFPYCQGLTTFTTSFSANQTSGIGNPIDGASGVLSYTGGNTTSFNLSNPAYTGNPNGAVQTLTGSSSFGANINYNFSIRHSQAYPFPTVCPTCNDVGNPVIVDLLPQITLNPPANAVTCEGEEYNLNNSLPTANIPGTVSWFTANPTSGGTLISPPTVTPATGGSTYFAQFSATADATCKANTTVTITPTANPTINALTPPAPICQGDVVNLNALNSSISTAPGSFTWFRGNPQTNPAAAQLPTALAQTQTPSNGTTYCCVFTDAITGCQSQTCRTYTVNPTPVLTPPVVQPSVCPGTAYNLTNLQSGLTTEAGTFQWYQGNPTLGVTVSNPSAVTPTTSNNNYCTVFTDAVNGCKSTVCVTININATPALNNIPNAGNICSGTVVDLTQLQPSITTQSGSFQWYLGNPSTTGVAVADPNAVVPASGNVFYAVFTDALTGCHNTATVNYSVNPTPTMTAPSPAPICGGTLVNLTNLQNNISTQPLIYQWYNGDPLNGGTALTPAQAQNQIPTGTETYYVVGTNFFNCSNTVSFGYTVNPSVALNNVGVQGPICNGSAVDLTALQPSLTTTPGTFVWYNGTTALTLAQAQAQVLTFNQDYRVVFSASGSGCQSSDTISYNVSTAVTGATAAYNCTTNQLEVNLATTTGGTSPYSVDAASPNQDGQTLPNGANWTVIVSDATGCTQTPLLTGTVACIVCDAGVASVSNDTLCCAEQITLSVSNRTLTPGHITAWAITPQATGPVTNSTQLQAAAAANMVFPAQANGDYNLNGFCNLPNGFYYATPAIAQSMSVDPIVWDTFNGCRPVAAICPSLHNDPNNPGWVVDTFLGVYPNGDTMDVVMQLTSVQFGPPGLSLDVDSTLLNGFFPGGQLPCLPLDLLYNGNPNGNWSLIINNGGVGALYYSIPDFTITVDADSCAALNGVDQVYTVTGQSGVIQPGATATVSFVIPPIPSSFPAISPTCEDYGTPALFYVNSGICTGVHPAESMGKLIVVPNPTDGFVQVEMSGIAAGSNLRFSLYDFLGRNIMSREQNNLSGMYTEVLDLNNLPNGIYSLVVTSDKGETKTVKVVKSN